MTKFQIISWVFIILGATLQLFHVPFGSEIMFLGCIQLFTYSIIYFFKNVKTNLPYVLLNLSFSFWSIYLFVRLHYWNFLTQRFAGFPLIFLIPLLTTLLCILFHIINRTNIKTPQIILLIYFVFCLMLSFTNSDRVYYFYHLTPTFHQKYRDFDYKAWDKYSWFLYLEDKQDEALEANLNAQKALEVCKKIKHDEKAFLFSTKLKEHEQNILNKNWNDYY